MSATWENQRRSFLAYGTAWRPIHFWLQVVKDGDERAFHHAPPPGHDLAGTIIRVGQVDEHTEETITRADRRPPGLDWQEHERFECPDTAWDDEQFSPFDGTGETVTMIAWRRQRRDYLYEFETYEEFVQHAHDVHEKYTAMRRSEIKLVEDKDDPDSV